MPPEFRIATGLMARFLEWQEATAITMPWSIVYILPEHSAEPGVIRHEQAHLDQIQRHGPVRFSLQYLWGLARYGYWDSPYEVEAREWESRGDENAEAEDAARAAADADAAA